MSANTLNNMKNVIDFKDINFSVIASHLKYNRKSYKKQKLVEKAFEIANEVLILKQKES
jgi:hypothetical protein